MKENFYLLGIGGMGMSGIALYLDSLGYHVEGSDRDYNRGRCLKLSKKNIKIHPQGSDGLEKLFLSSGNLTIIASRAVEDNVPEVQFARKKKITLLKREQFLASEFNKKKIKIGIIGSGGKSTTSSLLTYILIKAGFFPNFIIGAMINEIGNGGSGKSDIFIIELDESRGKMDRYNPDILLFTNLFEEHRKISELRNDFSLLFEKTEKIIFSSMDELLYKKFKNKMKPESLNIEVVEENFLFQLLKFGNKEYKIPLIGEHNFRNIKLAIEGASQLGIKIEKSLKILESFPGVEYRMNYLGTFKKINVFNDFAHAPLEIENSYKSFCKFSNRIIYIYQPHGFTPTFLHKDELAEIFSNMRDKDILILTDIYYGGGTVEKKISGVEFFEMVERKHHNSIFVEDISNLNETVLKLSVHGDIVVYAGARTVVDYGKRLIKK